jgi:hypothetical protein
MRGISELSTDSESYGTAPYQNPILKSSQVIPTSCRGVGPKRRPYRIDGSRTKQSTSPSANTMSAAGTRLRDRRGEISGEGTSGVDPRSRTQPHAHIGRRSAILGEGTGMRGGRSATISGEGRGTGPDNARGRRRGHHGTGGGGLRASCWGEGEGHRQTAREDGG